MFEAAKEGGGAVWVMLGTGFAALALACAGCAGIGWELVGRSIYADLFPAPDPLADLADPVGEGPDHLAVHRSLLPSWIISAGGGEPDEEGYAGLAAAVASDEGMTLLVDRMAAHMEDPTANADALIDDTLQWNRRMDQIGAPWYVHGVVRGGQNGTQFYVKTYRALFSGAVTWNEQPLRVRLLTRVDSLNVVEGYLGLTADPGTGALVLADRVAEHALEDLWPLLDPESADPQAGPLVAEMRAGIAPDALATLEAHAPARRAMMDAVRHIRDRRECGSRFRIFDVPYAGFAADEVTAMSDYAWVDRGEECPRLRVEEARAIAAGSADKEELTPAVEALLAWATRASAIHEGRHAADAVRFGDAEDVECDGCPAELDPEARAEASAYVESFAHEGTAAAAWWQACSVEIATYGAHSRAMSAIVAELAPEGCQGPVPEELPRRARELADRWFRRRELVALPADWPERVRIPER